MRWVRTGSDRTLHFVCFKNVWWKEHPKQTTELTVNVWIPGYTRRMIAYDTKANKFVKCENLKERRMHHSATVINNKLYVTGGRILNGHDVIEDSDCFECYDPKTDVWTSKGSLPYKLFDHGSLPLVCVSNRPNPPWPTAQSLWSQIFRVCSLLLIWYNMVVSIHICGKPFQALSHSGLFGRVGIASNRSL